MNIILFNNSTSCSTGYGTKLIRFLTNYNNILPILEWMWALAWSPSQYRKRIRAHIEEHYVHEHLLYLVLYKLSHSHVTLSFFLFIFKANSISSLLECTWSLKKVVIGKSCLQKPIQANLPCIWKNDICDNFTYHVTFSRSWRHSYDYDCKEIQDFVKDCWWLSLIVTQKWTDFPKW